MAIAVFWLVGSNTTTDIGAYKGVKWLSGGILASVGLLLLAAFAKGGSQDGMGSFVFWGYLFFSLPHVLLIWWTRKNAVGEGLTDKSKSSNAGDDNDLRVVKNGEPPEIYRALLDETNSGNGDTFVRDLAIVGLTEIQNVIKSIDSSLRKEEKFKLAIKSIAKLTSESESIAKIWFSTYTFGYLFDDCKGFEIEALQQGVYYGLFKNSEECTVPLHANFDYYVMIGYCSKFTKNTGGKISSRSIGGWDDAKKIIEEKIVYRKNSEFSRGCLKKSLASAEASVNNFKAKLSPNSLEKACHKFSNYSVTPIFGMLTNPASVISVDVGTIGDYLRSDSLAYPGLIELLNLIQSQRNDAILEIRSAAIEGKATSLQLKELSGKVASDHEKFLWLAQALVQSVGEVSKKSVLTLPALKKLDEHWRRIESQSEDFDFNAINKFSSFDDLDSYLKAKLSLKKVLDKNLKSQQINQNSHHEILSSEKNFPCPMCAEVIGEKVRECPYCQHHLE
ncbi:hypothetical protein B9Z46_14330 [Limnohabitans sp. Hippo4]|nr:hypothetical protein B9Z46_14330 [Limnohabitans sp. Hippo4]